jgi:hypothetical protein
VIQPVIDVLVRNLKSFPWQRVTEADYPPSRLDNLSYGWRGAGFFGRASGDPAAGMHRLAGITRLNAAGSKRRSTVSEPA